MRQKIKANAINNLKLSCLFAFLIAFPICSGCASRGASRETENLPIPFQHVDIGLCEDYPKDTRSLTAARRDLELLRTNHIHVLRIAFAWDTIETAPGQYDWSFWDDFVQMATDEFGIRLIPYVCYTPKWESTGNATNFWRFPPKDNTRFAQFVKTIVRQYKGRIHSWEIWNEPDNPEYWEGSVEQFAEMFKAGSRAVREADPTAKVVLGGIAWNLEFLRALFEWQRVSPDVDVVNLHSYYETWSSDPIEHIADHVIQAHRIIREYGNGQPIWLAEIGYSNSRKGTYVSAAYRARFDYEHTAQFQAQALGRAFSSALATGRVGLIAWYRIHDLPPSTRVIGDENNLRLGVLNEAGHPKPVLKALTFFNALFSDDFRCLDAFILATRTIQSDSEVHVFQNRGGEEFVTSWLRAVTVHSDSNNAADERRETLEVIFRQREFCDYATAYDDLGRRVAIVRLQRGRDARKILTIPLRGGDFKVYDCAP